MPNNQTPEEFSRNLRDSWSEFSKTMVAIATGVGEARRQLAENSEAISIAIENARNVGVSAVTMVAVPREAWQKKAVPVLRMVKINADTAKRAAAVGARLTDAGWLPWILSPTEDLIKSDDPVAFFEGWVVTEWPTIAEKLTENAGLYGAGESPSKTLRAAILLHEAGLYEQVPRVLFPEIEKCVAEHFYREKIRQEETQLPKFRSVIGMIWSLATTGFALLAPGMGVAQGQMHVLALHSYVGSSKKNPRKDLPNDEFFPNRNRVIHGWRSGEYDSRKASLNSLFLYDTMMLGLAFTMGMVGGDLTIEDGNSPR